MPALFNPALMLSVLSVGLLGACASAPPVNSLATVAVQSSSAGTSCAALDERVPSQRLQADVMQR